MPTTALLTVEATCETQTELRCPRKRFWVACTIVSLTLLATVVRSAQVRESLWLDELHTAWVVAGSPADVAVRARMGNQSPLYFYVAQAATKLLGMNELSLRLPSLAAGLALVPLAFWLAARWTRSVVGAAVVAALVAIDHDCVFYAQEARPYALVQLLGLAQVFCFWQLLTAPSWRWRTAFVLATVTLFYLHYTSVLLLAGEAAALTAWNFAGCAGTRDNVAARSSPRGNLAPRSSPRGRLAPPSSPRGRLAPRSSPPVPRGGSGGCFSSSALTIANSYWLNLRARGGAAYTTGQLAIDLGVTAVAICPALPHVLEIAGRRHNWSLFVPQPTAGGLLTLFPLAVYVALPLGGWLVARCVQWCASAICRSHVAGNDRSDETGPLTLPSPPLSPAVPEENVRRVGERTHVPGDDRSDLESVTPRLVVLMVGWFVVPLVASWLLTAWDVARLFMVRYLIVAALAPIVLCGILVSACPGRWYRIELAAAVLAAAVYQGGMLAQLRSDGRFIGDRNQDWRGAVAMIREAPHDRILPVFVRSGYLEADRLRFDASDLLREYCLAPVTGIYCLERDTRELVPLPTTRAGQLGSPSLARVRAHRGAWFLVNGSVRSREQIETDLLVSFSQAGMVGRVTLRRHFGDVLVLRLESQPTSASSRARP